MSQADFITLVRTLPAGQRSVRSHFRKT